MSGTEGWSRGRAAHRANLGKPLYRKILSRQVSSAPAEALKREYPRGDLVLATLERIVSCLDA